LTPRAQASLNLEGPDLNYLNLRSMLKIFCAGSLSLSPTISVQFTLGMRVAARNRKKTITLYFGGSKSFKVIDVDIPKKLVLVMISSISVPICNHFNIRRRNNGRI